MAQQPTPEFRAEAIGVALTSGLPRQQVAADFGVGFSTLNRWIQLDRRNPEKPSAQSDLEREVAELRKESRMLREEREMSKKGGSGKAPVGRFPDERHPVFCGAKQMRFPFIAKNADMQPVDRLCQIMDVSPRGYRAYRNRPLSQSQRKDMVVRARIREQFALSLGRYGRPRMTVELKEMGFDVGRRRIGRLMNENGIEVKRNKKFKATTDSNHAFNISPNLLNRDFHADAPNKKWVADISFVWTREGWLYLAVILDPHSRRVVGWAVSNRMKRDFAIRAMNMTIALRQNGFKVYKSETGNCYERDLVRHWFENNGRVPPPKHSSSRSKRRCCDSGPGEHVVTLR